MATEANTSTLSTNLNVDPYYDDFDEAKNFHRILYRPGLAVQARELTQMQTILQNQIDRFAEHIFKEGSVVRGCQVLIDREYNYVKLRNNNSTGSSVTASSFLNKTVKGTTSGVRALVINTNDGSEANTPDFKTFFVKYTAANTSGTKFFANNEILTATDGSGLSANTIKSTQGASVGFGSAVKIQSGIVYAKDHFIRVPEQTLVLDKYSANGTYRIGLDVTESIIKESDDSTLLDPASGSYNYAAPGAARLKLTATLAKKSVSVTSANNFIELAQIKNGILQSRSDSPQYSAIRDYLAQRTSDESGDYVVKGHSVGLREHLKSANNQGVYTAAQGGNTSLLAVEVQPGKAYVKGYDIENLISTIIPIDKGIDTQSIQDVKTLMDYGNYIIVDNLVGNWDLNDQGVVSLRENQANAISTLNYSLTTFPGNQIGTARVRGLEYYSGTPGLPSAQYKLYLTDVRMSAGKSFPAVQSICFSAGTGYANGKADILASNGLNANTVDPSYDVAVFKLPVSYVKTIRGSGSSINTDFTFYKKFDITFNSSGSATLSTGDASETLDGTGVLSSSAINSDYYIVSRGAANTNTLTGTVSVNVGGNTVTGSGTQFTSQVTAGDVIRIHQGANTNLFIVSQVGSATSLSVLGSFTSKKVGVTYCKQFEPGQVLYLAGKGRNGNRSINVTSGTSATISINETLNANSSSTLAASVIVKLNKSNGQEATKTVNRSRLVEINVGNGGGTSYVANTTGPWALGLSDGFKLVSVRKKSGSNFASTSEGTDVTSNFTLDTGQRDNYYDHARLTKKTSSGLSLATGDRLLVTLDHFTHSNRQRGYFTVDSYPVNDATAGTDTTKIYTYEIPVYVSPNDGTSYDLRNCIDLRPRISDTANSVTSLTNISINPLTSTTLDTASGGLHFSPPQTDYNSDLDYYLSRRDLVVMTKEGKMNAIRGVSSLSPVTPFAPNDAMPLAKLFIAPYPSLPFETARRNNRPDLSNAITPIKNNRYTMKDIGAIQNRVENLEYYTSLSLLEKDAKDLSIRDSAGLDRFKNGIMVDSFKGHNVGNVFDQDYKIAIDKENGVARPPFALNNIKLFYHTSSSSNVVRTNVTTGGVSRDQTVLISNSQVLFSNGETISSGGSSGKLRYQVDNKLYIEEATGNFVAAASVTGGSSGKTATISSVTVIASGDLVTLPYTHQIMVNQPYATTTRNAAGAEYLWNGILTLTPEVDDWMDATQNPDVLFNYNGTEDHWQNLPNGWQLEWNDWQTVWTTTQLGDVSTSTTSQEGTQAAGPGRDAGDLKGIYTTTTTQQTYTTTQNQTRTGILTIPVNSLAAIGPYMRSRIVRFTGQGLKPSTRLYAFFDNTNVTAYVTPTNSSFANTGNEGSILSTDSSGNVYGLFRIPADNSLRFRTGDRILRLTDNPTNAVGLGLVVTSAQGTYTAAGLGQTTLTINVTDTRTITSTGSNVLGSSSTFTQIPPRDPIAQSFLVEPSSVFKIDTNGIFVTKIDLYFSNKDSTFPVAVEIREVDPTSKLVTNKLVPFGRAIVSSSQINTSDDGTKPTPVYFPSPVYLQNGKEYAFMVIPTASNPNYRVYVARLGDVDLTTGNRVTSQPASGMMFISANDRTYSPVQEEDMKFTLYVANFDKSLLGSAILKNENRDYFIVTDQSAALHKVGEIVHGETLLVGTFANTKTLSVANGTTFAQGMTSGATGTVTLFTSSAVRVRNVSLNAKFKGGEKIRIRTNNVTTGGIVGNSTGAITSATTPTGTVIYYDPKNYSNTHLHLANVSFSNSGAAGSLNRVFVANTWIRGQTNGYNARIASFKSVQADLINLFADTIAPSNTSIAAYTKMATSTSGRDTSYLNVNINRNTEFTAPRYVYSRSIESNTSASSSTLAANRSSEFKFNLTSNNILASPALDLRRTSLITVENLINSNTAIGSSEDYVKNGGNANARYITRRVTLADGQDAEDLKVYVSAYRPSGSQVNVYYKILNREDSDTFDDAKWITMTQNTATGFISTAAYSSSEDQNDFIELTFDPPTYDNTNKSGANNSNSGVVEYRNSSKARFVGFQHFAIKIVLTKDNTTRPPKIRDLRVIALQR